MKPEDITVVHSQKECAAAILAAANNGPTEIHFVRPSGGVTKFRFNMVKYKPGSPLIPEMDEARAMRIAARIRRSPKELWK